MRAFFSLVVAAAILAGCGGGGGSSYDPSTGESLVIQLVTTGVADPSSSPAPGGQVVVTSSAQLTSLAAGRFTIPASLANFDYTRGTVIYVEGIGDLDLTSVARIDQIRRSDGLDSITSQVCRSVPLMAGSHRPFALYTTPNILNLTPGIATTTGLFPCAMVSLLPSTFVAGGLAPITDFSPRPPTVIRDQAVWDNTKSKLPAGSIPPQFANPDFSQVVLIYVETLGDADINLYVRMMGVYANVDGSHDVVAEQCGLITDFIHMYNHYAVYQVPRFTGDARVTHAPVAPPNCLTAR
jgi:hypothetical protein